MTGTEHEVHRACGVAHGLNDDCLASPDSPRGMVQRALAASLRGPAGALDRLAAVEELGRWLADQEQMTVIGARMAGCSWADMGGAIGVSRSRAVARWRDSVRGFEAAGILQPDQLPPAADPVDLAAAADLGDARAWCRWCGHRIVLAGGGWAHNSTDGHPGDFIEVACPGPEPWPGEED